MKTSSQILAICALLGTTQAIKDYYYNDDTQYEDDGIKSLVEIANKKYSDEIAAAKKQEEDAKKRAEAIAKKEQEEVLAK